MPSFGARWWGTLLLAVAVATVAHAQSPKRVLMLHSFGPEFGDLYARDMRVQLGRQLPGRLELYEAWLLSARFTNIQKDAAFAGYLSTLFADHPIDLVITLGAPAADFVQKYQSLFRTTPELLTDIEERRASGASLTPNETAVAGAVSFPALVENILRVQPRTSTVAVVIGNSPIEKYWVGQIRDTLKPFTNRFVLTFLNDLPFTEVLKRAATLPAGSALLYVLLSPEVEGIPQDEDTALAALHAVANAPIFSYTDAYLGKGIVGGPLISGEEQGREAVSVAARLLSGERASDIRPPLITLGKSKFDWRELKRWNIRESDLPPGSTILFREPSAWERYRWQMVSVGLVLLLQTALIVTLLHERRRRRIAEMDARQRASRLQRLSRRLLAVQEEERSHLSRELHDEFGQLLATVSLHLHAMRRVAGDAAQAAGDEAVTLLSRAGAQLRTLAVQLHPRMLETAGLDATLRWLAERHQQHTGMATEVVGHVNGVSGDLAVACFRVVQEALTNVVRHAGAQHVRIELTQSDGRLELAVGDDGVGFDVERTLEGAAGRGNLGLVGMTERVELLGGVLALDSQPGRGTLVRITLPLVAG